jgi:hypothetical protein
VSPNSNAVFGLSKCERLEKSIASEEKIGVELWRDLRDSNTAIIKSSPSLSEGVTLDPYKAEPTTPHLRISRVTINDARVFYGNLRLLIPSDIKRYKLMESRSQCFMPREVADARSSRSSAAELAKYINNQIRMWRKENSNNILSSEYYEWIVSTYPRYRSIIK